MDAKLFIGKKALAWLQEVMGRINAIWIRIKYNGALWLDGRLSGYSKRKATMMLVLFCSAISILLALNITNSCHAGDTKRIHIQEISKVSSGQARSVGRATTPKIIPIELQNARKYLDSLARDPAGMRVYDSLMAARPGLLDSLGRAEYYYREMK